MTHVQGWGGRLFGFLASNCKKYGVEPSTKSFQGLQELNDTYNKGILATFSKMLNLEMFVQKVDAMS